MEINNKLLFTKIPEETLFGKTTIVEYAKVSDDLISTMIRLKGIGLAANQVGLCYRAFAIMLNNTPEVMFNPEITEKVRGLTINEEGCLSYPGIKLLKARIPKITVVWRDHAGLFYEEQLEGTEAICFQHELSHLNGVDWEKD